MKSVNKKAVEHNLALAIKKASLAIKANSGQSDIDALHKAAQDIVDCGYELEDMKITPALMGVIMSQLVETGFVPVFDKTTGREEK